MIGLSQRRHCNRAVHNQSAQGGLVGAKGQRSHAAGLVTAVERNVQLCQAWQHRQPAVGGPQAGSKLQGIELQAGQVGQGGQGGAKAGEGDAEVRRVFLKALRRQE